MKACLVFPRQTALPPGPMRLVDHLRHKPSYFPPLGMLYLMSNTGYGTDFIDSCLEGYSDEELSGRLRGYDVVAFGGSIFQSLQARNVSRLLRAEGVTTIYGGPNVTVNWGMYVDVFDVLIRGEAEVTFDETLARIDAGKTLNGVPGVVFKEGGRTVVNQERPFIEDLDTLRYPARERVDMEAYERVYPPFSNTAPIDSVVSARGCPHECAFCSSRNVWHRTSRVRRPEEVAGEIAYMKDRFGTRGVFFAEDTFAITKKRTLELCRHLKGLDIQWICDTRVDTLDEETVREMAAAGCTSIILGLESCSDETLRFIRKGITVADAKRAVGLCSKYGIDAFGNMIIGLPNETREDMLRNRAEFRKWDIKGKGYPRFITYPGSDLYGLVKREGLDRYEYEEIIVPDTRHVHADEVTRISNEGLRWKRRLISEIPAGVYRRLWGERHLSCFMRSVMNRLQ